MQTADRDDALQMLLRWVEADTLIYGAAANVLSKVAGFGFAEFWSLANGPRDGFVAALRARLSTPGGPPP